MKKTAEEYQSKELGFRSDEIAELRIVEVNRLRKISADTVYITFKNIESADSEELQQLGIMTSGYQILWHHSFSLFNLLFQGFQSLPDVRYNLHIFIHVRDRFFLFG